MKVVTDAVAQTVELCSEGCGRTRKGLYGSARGGATQPWSPPGGPFDASKSCGCREIPDSEGGTQV